MHKITLTLYITGQTPRSAKAIRNITAMCQMETNAEIEIKIVDVLERPEDAEIEKIIATPTLIKKLPPPVRRIIGDLSDIEQVRIGLDLDLTPSNGLEKDGLEKKGLEKNGPERNGSAKEE